VYIKAQTGVGSANTPTPEKSNVQRINDKQRRQTSSRVLTALSGKQKEPNRGQGSERHPASPRAHVTGPTTEEVTMFSNIDEGAKDKISPHDAGEILNAHGDRDADFHQLSSSHVEGLLTHAKRVGYHKSKHAPGSRARMFHQFLKNHASRVHEESTVQEDVVEVPYMTFDAPESVDEGRESEYTANQHLSSSASRRKPGHYLMKNGRPLHAEPHKSSADALGAYKRIGNNAGISIHHVKENDETVPGSVKTLAELKKSTLGSYINKAAASGAEHMADVQHWVSQGKGGHKMADRADKAYTKRQSGIAKAVGRLAKEAIENPNSSGQGHDTDHVTHPLHATIAKHGYKYSHSTPIHRADTSTYISHTYKHGGHNVSTHSDPAQGRQIWSTSTSTSSGRHHSGIGSVELEHHLKSKGRRFGLKKEEVIFEGAETHEHYKDHTKNPYHSTLVGHGFVHQATEHKQNHLNRDPKHDYTEHRYSHPSHGKSHVIVSQYHDASMKKNHTFLHRHEQSNGIMAPSHGDNKEQLHRSLSGEYGVPKGMKPPKVMAWEKHDPPKYKMHEDAPAMSAGASGDPGKVQNPTDNYSSQLARRKTHITNYLRRSKPVGESVLDGHVPPELSGVTVGVLSPEELKKNKELARQPKKVGPGGVDKE
jgi:hypothetical protein